MVEWIKNYAIGWWFLGGFGFGLIDPVYGGTFMLVTYIAFMVYCWLTFPRR